MTWTTLIKENINKSYEQLNYFGKKILFPQLILVNVVPGY